MDSLPVASSVPSILQKKIRSTSFKHEVQSNLNLLTLLTLKFKIDALSQSNLKPGLPLVPAGFGFNNNHRWFRSTSQHHTRMVNAHWMDPTTYIQLKAHLNVFHDSLLLVQVAQGSGMRPVWGQRLIGGRTSERLQCS